MTSPNVSHRKDKKQWSMLKKYIMKKKHCHYPSFYRRLIQEQKSKHGRSLQKLIHDARTIQDPYYFSLALFRLSIDSRLSISEAKALAIEAISAVNQEPRLWRQAELYAKLAKHAKKFREEFSKDDSEFLLDELLKKIQEFPKGDGLSQNIGELIKHFGCARIPSLLAVAMNNTDFLLKDSKSVIRYWATTCQKTIPLETMYHEIMKIQDPFIQSKVLGYLYLQCTKNQIYFPQAFHTSIKAALQLENSEKITILRYLSRHVQSKQDFITLKEIILSLVESLHQCQLLSTLGGSADKNNHQDISLICFNEGLKRVGSVENNKDREKIQINLANGLIKINKKQQAKKILRDVHQTTTDNTNKKLIEKTMMKNDQKFDAIHPVGSSQKTNQILSKDLSDSTGCILGLYNTYDGPMKPVHMRMIARAAPLCAAFGLDLALLHFPIDDADNFIRQVTTDTKIGQEGKYIQFLFEKRRIHLLDSIQLKASVFSNFEIVIATTSHPDEKKKLSMKQALQKKLNRPEGKLIIMMGLGKKGLPAHLLKSVDYHLELTGVNVSLETSTVMGVISMKIYEEMKKLKGKD